MLTLLLLLSLQDPLPADDGYRGIWYMNQPSKDEGADKVGVMTFLRRRNVTT